MDELLQAEADAGLFLPDQPGAVSRAALEQLAEAADITVCPSLSEKPGDRPRALLTDQHYRTWSFAFSSDSKSLLTAGNDGFIRLWNLRTFEVALALRHGPGHSLFIGMSRDGTHLVSQASMGTLRFWTAPLLTDIDAARRTP